MYLIPNGVDVDFFKPKYKGSKIRDKFSCPLIVFVGVLYKSCDLDIVIDAMKYVVNDLPAKLIIVGDGPRKIEFFERVKKLKLERNVIFVGHKRRELVPEFIGAADVVVLPMKDNLANHSRSPVKLGEYLASGKAVVASNVGVAKEIIENYHNGILTSNNPKKFGEATVELLYNEMLRKKIERNARKTAEEKLDWKIIAKKLRNIYNGLCLE
ncbi:MAG: glycosyltransferase [Candidatus Aenigmarchaeota archaeon]|nr:glycosyltransferase [Candidatus Aenigmarchaeota archaeon]